MFPWAAVLLVAVCCLWCQSVL